MTKKKLILILAAMLLVAAAAPAQRAGHCAGGQLDRRWRAEDSGVAGGDGGSDTGRIEALVWRNWHPTKREMLIATRFAETPQLHLVKMPGGERQQLTFFADSVGSGRFHPNGGDYVVFAKTSAEVSVPALPL